jgi:hypothetical protein
MITGNARNLTDAQWLSLMEIVTDEKEIDLTLPSEGRVDAILIRDGVRHVIAPDGNRYSRSMDLTDN